MTRKNTIHRIRIWKERANIWWLHISTFDFQRHGLFQYSRA
jgi:hypothetical protein